jgi:glycosyltransferase involved in cell wall biosynthesis
MYESTLATRELSTSESPSAATRPKGRRIDGLRVLVVSHYYPEHGGGVEIAAHQIAKRLAARGMTVEWVASQDSPESSTAAGIVPVRAWNVSERLLGVPYPVWGLSAIGTLMRAVRRCDVVHLHDTLYMGNVLASWRAGALNKPVLVTQHVGLVPYRNPILSGTMEAANRLIAARVLNRASVTVFYSKTTERYFQPLLRPDTRFVWVTNGLDATFQHSPSPAARTALKAELGLPITRPVLLFVGRFVEKKGMATLSKLVRRLPDVTWAFIGWGPDDPTRWRAPNVISFGKCPQSRMARIYQAADLLVLPSVGEGFPLVVQESMGCGTPVAISTETASAHPGVEKIAWSADPSPDAFESLVRRILSDPGSLEQRRAATAAYARREWDWERCADDYAALFGSIARS